MGKEWAIAAQRETVIAVAERLLAAEIPSQRGIEEWS
jgi:hypothetical protein